MNEFSEQGGAVFYRLRGLRRLILEHLNGLFKVIDPLISVMPRLNAIRLNGIALRQGLGQQVGPLRKLGVALE